MLRSFDMDAWRVTVWTSSSKVRFYTSCWTSHRASHLYLLKDVVVVVMLIHSHEQPHYEMLKDCKIMD